MAEQKKKKSLLQILGPKGNVYDDVSRGNLPRTAPTHDAMPLGYAWDYEMGQPLMPRYNGGRADPMRPQSKPEQVGRALLKYLGGVDLDPNLYYKMPGARTVNPSEKVSPAQIKEDMKRLKIQQFL